jgi:hypothetical protein
VVVEKKELGGAVPETAQDFIVFLQANTLRQHDAM